VAWAYYINNDDENARRLAAQVLETGSSGDWTVQAHWTTGLSNWRQNDPKAAAAAFEQVMNRASNDDMRAAGAYWAARAWMNAGQPAKVEALLKRAAQRSDSFYGMLARETLGMDAPQAAVNPMRSAAILDKPAVRAALALHDIGENDLADQLLRRQAAIGTTRDYDSLLSLTDTMDLPATQIWLAQHGPAGHDGGAFGRFPRPSWRPDGGWRVAPALVYAHALQESVFRTDAVSPAGARGLMQVMPGTARMMDGQPVPLARLTTPSTNLEYGQRYLETLRDMKATGGLLPKVMAAYNAGPLPVERWNTQVRDNGDPLLFMESLPYYETRAYVNIVMRNYWMYELRDDGRAEALTAMAQGKWPAFPSMKNGKAVELSYRITR
jgi:soluble lytic murein transglycosylase